jgi:hypothetical protein
MEEYRVLNLGEGYGSVRVHLQVAVVAMLATALRCDDVTLLIGAVALQCRLGNEYMDREEVFEKAQDFANQDTPDAMFQYLVDNHVPEVLNG